MSNQVRRGRRAEHAAQMQRVIEEFEQGGMTQAGFCRDRDLPLSTFRFWRRRVAESRKHGFVEVDVVAEASTRSTGMIELLLPGGVIARLGVDSDESTIRRVIRAASPSC